MVLESDIVLRLQSDFTQQEFSVALNLMRSSGKKGRVARCIVVAAAGSMPRFRDLMHLSKQDYREVIAAAENASGDQGRDLRASFLIDDPVHFWAGDLAVFLQSRRFQLADIQSNRAVVGPFDEPGDLGEGTATFHGLHRTLAIRKQNRRWQVVDESAELAEYGLDVEFDDPDEFRQQLGEFVAGLAAAQGL